MKNNDAALHARIPHDLKAACQIAARNDKRTLSSLIVKVLNDHCEQVGAFDELHKTHNAGEKSQ